MNSRIKISKIALLALFLMVGCTDFVETELPPSQLTGKAVFSERSTATAALANIYAGLRDRTLITGSAHGIGNLLGHYSDELDFYGSGINWVYDFSTHSVLSTDSELLATWNQSYNLIYACNSLLEGLEGNGSIDLADRQQLQGEALFLRSFIHFYLNQLFGAIPYITGTDYVVNSQIKKLENVKVIENLILDLNKSISLLPENYLVPDRVRVNQYVALAFLARVQLYNGNWEAAISASSEVLAREDIYTWEENLNQVFLKDSKGTIWQLSPSSMGGNTLEALNYIFETAPPPVSALTQSLMDDFSPNDQRVGQWTKSVTNGNEVWYHPYKYKAFGPSGSSLENSVVLRLAEIYLIRAEARIKMNDFGGAMSDINKIRNRAGLPDLTGLDKVGLEAALLRERRLELFTEFGHRWFDLKRFNKAGEVLLPLKPNWRETDRLFPIPQAELLANPNLKPQNDGY